MGRNFNSRVPHVQPGSSVSASNTSAATRSLESRTNYLKEVLDSIEARRLLVHDHQAVHPDILEGQAVYWNADNQRFEAALAQSQTDTATGVLTAAPSADCVGIVLVKYAATDAMIGLGGAAKLTTAQLANVIDGEATPGRYYLSAADPGKLLRQKPPITVAVIIVLGPANACEVDSWVVILPQARDFLESHVHQHFQLIARPAGTHVPPEIGTSHSITDPDAALPGWLPADHESFNGLAPAGANFGYNLAAHSSLSRVWPPVPAAAAVLEMFKATDGPVPLAGRVLPEFVKIDNYGIWWMTACYDQVPWPTTIDTTPTSESLSSESETSTSSESESCPAVSDVRLFLSFAKMTFATDKSVVTSLQAAAGQAIEFVNCDGDPATTGDLFARMAISAMIDADEVYGGQVLKSIIDGKLTFGRGWVAEGIIAGSDRVIVSGSRQRRRTPGDTGTPLVHQGLVSIDLADDPADRELSPEITKLGDAAERSYKGTLYIGLPTDRDSSIRCRFNVPYAGLPTTPAMKLRLLMFGLAAGPWCEVTAAYYRVVSPDEDTPTPLGEGDTALTFDVVTPSEDVPANNTILVESSSFTVAPGDTIFVEIARDAEAEPLFNSEIGIIRVNGVVHAGE